MLVIVGAACSGKNTLIKEIEESEDFKGWKLVLEYTTRPIGPNETGDEYHFITEKEYWNRYFSGEFATKFEVDTVKDMWYYSIAKSDIRKDTFLVTNPTSLRQLKNKYKEDIFSVLLDVSQRERLIRMLKRGDNISESYRRSVHDEGHFSGIKKDVDKVLNGEVSPIEILKSLRNIM